MSLLIERHKTHEEMRYPSVISLHFATPLAFNNSDGGFPWDDLRKILHGGQRMARVPNGEEILLKVSTQALSRVHERYRRQTDR